MRAAALAAVVVFTCVHSQTVQDGVSWIEDRLPATRTCAIMENADPRELQQLVAQLSTGYTGDASLLQILWTISQSSKQGHAARARAAAAASSKLLVDNAGSIAAWLNSGLDQLRVQDEADDDGAGAGAGAGAGVGAGAPRAGYKDPTASFNKVAHAFITNGTTWCDTIGDILIDVTTDMRAAAAGAAAGGAAPQPMEVAFERAVQLIADITGATGVPLPSLRDSGRVSDLAAGLLDPSLLAAATSILEALPTLTAESCACDAAAAAVQYTSESTTAMIAAVAAGCADGGAASAAAAGTDGSSTTASASGLASLQQAVRRLQGRLERLRDDLQSVGSTVRTVQRLSDLASAASGAGSAGASTTDGWVVGKIDEFILARMYRSLTGDTAVQGGTGGAAAGGSGISVKMIKDPTSKSSGDDEPAAEAGDNDVAAALLNAFGQIAGAVRTAVPASQFILGTGVPEEHLQRFAAATGHEIALGFAKLYLLPLIDESTAAAHGAGIASLTVASSAAEVVQAVQQAFAAEVEPVEDGQEVQQKRFRVSPGLQSLLQAAPHVLPALKAVDSASAPAQQLAVACGLSEGASSSAPGFATVARNRLRAAAPLLSTCVSQLPFSYSGDGSGSMTPEAEAAEEAARDAWHRTVHGLPRLTADALTAAIDTVGAVTARIHIDDILDACEDGTGATVAEVVRNRVLHPHTPLLNAVAGPLLDVLAAAAAGLVQQPAHALQVTRVE